MKAWGPRNSTTNVYQPEIGPVLVDDEDQYPQDMEVDGEEDLDHQPVYRTGTGPSSGYTSLKIFRVAGGIFVWSVKIVTTPSGLAPV